MLFRSFLLLFLFPSHDTHTEERENILLSILDENERKINSRVFKGYDLETELEYNRFLIQERAIAERLEHIYIFIVYPFKCCTHDTDTALVHLRHNLATSCASTA